MLPERMERVDKIALTSKQSFTSGGLTMTDTKESILKAALGLFAVKGYEAVSVSQIAGTLGMTKGALYKHYKNKRDIFDSIFTYVCELDAERSRKSGVPEKEFSEMPDSFSDVSPKSLKEYMLSQFHYWSMDETACNFRKMLTLEQYKTTEAGTLYEKVLTDGPLTYIEDIFREMIIHDKLIKKEPRQLAVEFYAPFYLLLNMADRTGRKKDKEEMEDVYEKHMDDFFRKYLLPEEETRMQEMINIRNEEKADYAIVEQITREAFYNMYVPGCVEHYLVHIMREHEDFIPELDFVLELNGTVIGNIMYTKAWLLDEEGNKKEILTFGPVCIKPGYQRRGYGRKLIEHSFEKAVKLGYDTVVIFGSPVNYVGCGFKSCKKYNVGTENGKYPSAMMVRELIPGALDGHKWIYQDSPVMAISEEEAQKYDDTLEKMEKKYQPSQDEFYIMSHSFIEE